jgi:hypothetical protein
MNSMQPSLISLYFTMIILVGMIWYAGLEGTMRVFTYIELTIKYQLIRLKMYFMKRKLERQLGITNKP